MVAQWISVKQPKLWYGGTWDYPPPEEGIWDVGLYEMDTYISRLQNMVARYIVT